MSLYPTTIIDPDAALGNNAIASGTLICIPIDMTSSQMVQIVLSQLSLTQDYSLRTWVSVYPDGNAIAPGLFPILRNGGLPFIVYVPGQTPPSNTYAIRVTPGSYYLNILNLTNEANVFSFNLIELALAVTIAGCECDSFVSTMQPTRVPTIFNGCGSTSEVGTVLTTISSTFVLTGAFGTGFAGSVSTVPVSRTTAFVGCGSTGLVGAVRTTISSTLVITGVTGAGFAGNATVAGLRLTRSQRLWQAIRNKHQQR